jgi:hypothetical protein
LAFADAIETVPLSLMSICAPVCSWIARIVLPPGPMMSRTLSGLICIVTMRGAKIETSSRGALIAASMRSRM